MNKTIQPKILRMRQLVEYTSLSRAYIYQKINDGEFPEGYLLSPGIRVWFQQKIDDWLHHKMRKGK